MNKFQNKNMPPTLTGELKAAEAIPRELTLEASPLVAEQEVPSIEDLATPEQPDIGSAASSWSCWPPRAARPSASLASGPYSDH